MGGAISAPAARSTLRPHHMLCWDDVVRDKFNKLCCVLCHSAIGVGMGFVGWHDSDSASNREARGGQ